jgi:putative MATE family efflux protein
MSFRKPTLYRYSRQIGAIRSFRKYVIEAIAGSDRDFTKTSISKAIFLLSVPMILEMVMESVFAVVDIFFVSRLGADAVAMVGVTESLMTIVYSIGIGLSTGTMALIARRIGEGNSEQANQVTFHAILLGIVVSMFIAIPGILWSEEILLLMGVKEKVAADSAAYTGIMLGSNVVIMLLFIINAAFRSAGDAAVSMRVLWMANILNILLDPCLIFGLGPFPELGLKGAAIATAIGRGLAVSYQFYLLFAGRKRISLSHIGLKLDLSIIRRLFKLSAGGIGQSLIATSSWIILVRIIAEFGSIVLAGYTIAIRIILFVLLPAFGLSNAAGTLVGQNLGARQPKQAEQSVWKTGMINMIIMGTIAVLFISTPTSFVGLFTDNSMVLKAGAICLRYISYGFLFYALGMVLVQAFNGAGDTMTPTRINLVCFWLLEIPLAYLLALSFNLGEQGVYFAIVVSESMTAIIGLFIFLKGKWKLAKV